MSTQSCEIADIQHVGYRSHHLPNKTALFLTVQMADKILISANGAAMHYLQSDSERIHFGTKTEIEDKSQLSGLSRPQEGHVSSITLSSISRSCFSPGEQFSPGLCALRNCSQSARLDYTRLQSRHACHFLGCLATFAGVYFQP